MSGPRILLVNHSAEVSGAEQSLLAFLAAADRGRFEFEVACPGRGALAEGLARLRVPVRPVRLERLTRQADPAVWFQQGFALLRGTRQLHAVMRRVRPDLVHANTTIAALATVPDQDVPLVWHVRDLVPLGMAGRVIYGKSAAVIAISEAVAHTFAEDQDKVRVIHNGIDADGFAAQAKDGGDVRRTLNLPDLAAPVAVVAQLTPWKGHDVLLESWVEVVQRVPQAVLLVVGAAMWRRDLRWQRELQHRAEQLGLGGSVRFLGYRNDVPAVMSVCRCVVIPSQAEPFGRAALEAMALSKPVVGTAAGGLPEVVQDGGTGILVAPGDAAALAGAVIHVLADRALADELGRAGARRVREVFDIRRTARRTQEVYEEVLSSRRLADLSGKLE